MGVPKMIPKNENHDLEVPPFQETSIYTLQISFLKTNLEMYQNTQQTWACYPPTEIAHFGHSALKDMFGGVSLHVWPNIKPLTKQTKDCHVCSNNVKIYIACVCPCFTSILLS
jgi:hypothetical protein